MTGSILFKTPGSVHEIGALPVRIRTSDGEVVATGVSGTPIEVEAGDYFVWVRLPGGQETGSGDIVTVSDGETTVAAALRTATGASAGGIAVAVTDALAALAAGVASDPPAPPPPPAPAVWADAAAGGPALAMAADEPAETLAPAAAVAPVSSYGSTAAPPHPATAPAWLWSGNWLASWGDPETPAMPAGIAAAPPVVTLSTETPLILPGFPSSDQLLVLRTGTAAVPRLRFTIVPFDECTACIGDTADTREIAARLAYAGDDPVVTYRSTVVGATNALLDLVDTSALHDMVAVSDDMVKQGESALIGAGGSLLRALIGGYVLLRANRLEGLREWLDILAARPPVLADVAVLRAELFARLGEHDRALAELDVAISGPCPWFRSGLTYVTERVRFYLSVTDNEEHEFRIDDRDLPRFRLAHWRFARMMPRLVTNRILTTFDIAAADLPAAG